MTDAASRPDDDFVLVERSQFFQRLPYAAYLRLGSAMMRSARFDVMQHEKDQLLGMVAAEVLASRVVDDQRVFTVKHPETWWQHLKLSLPAWYQKRWPAQMVDTVIEVGFRSYDLYPRANINLRADQWGYPVRQDFLRTEIQSRWHVDDSGPAALRYADRFDLAYALEQRIDRNQNPWLRVLHVLNELGELGVNPDQLATEANVLRAG